MPSRSSKHVISLLKTAIVAIVEHPIILFPFLILVFIQLLLLEVLFFSPRYPLSIFFSPLIRTLYGEAFLHYPNNFILIPKLFQYVQMGTYIFFASYLIGVCVEIIYLINAEKKFTLRAVFRSVLSRYVHLLMAAVVMYVTFYLFFSSYDVLLQRARMIRSEAGVFFLIKEIIVVATPYVNLFVGALATALYAFVVPFIVIDRKKVFVAIWENFRLLSKSFWMVLVTVILATMLYLPILFFRNNVGLWADDYFPSLRVWIIVISIIVQAFIDCVIYSSLTSYFLFLKEQK